MKIGILGLHQSGKSTVYSAITGQPAAALGTAQEQFATVQVPDARLAHLAGIYRPKRVTPATADFVDIPGASIADGAARSQFQKHLASARQMDVLLAVVRDFENAAVPAHRDRVKPAADLDELWSELLFCDLDAATTRIERLEKSLKKPTKTHEQEKRELALLERCRDALEAETALSSLNPTEEETRMLSSFRMLTLKPLVVVFNVGENRIGSEAPPPPAHALASLCMSGPSEAEIAMLDEADRPAFLADLGIEQPARDRVIQACFEALGLIVFLTVGADEVRAWPVRRGASAVEAAGKIHSDLARGFIRAETCGYADFVEAGDMRAAKAAGKVRQEGKAYIVKDGDIINIKFNV